jgi:hypothetical protein
LGSRKAAPLTHLDCGDNENKACNSKKNQYRFFMADKKYGRAVTIRLTQDTFRRLESWRRRQSPIPSNSRAVHLLMEQALDGAKRKVKEVK